MQDLADKVGPALVRFGYTTWLADDMDIVTVGNHEEVWEFGLELGKAGVDCDREQETTQRTALLATHRVHDFTQTRTRFVEKDAGGGTVHEFGEAVDGGEMVEEWLPHLRAAPAVKSVLGVKGTVNVVRVEFEVGGDRSGNELTARRDSHTELEGFGFQEKGFRILTESGESKASQKAKEDVANDDGTEISLVVLRNRDTSAGVEQGHDGGRHLAFEDEVQDSCQVI